MTPRRRSNLGGQSSELQKQSPRGAGKVSPEGFGSVAHGFSLAATLLVLFVLLVLPACSADPPCVLGTRGWCENEMAAATVRAVTGRGEGQVDAEVVVIVEDGFSVDRGRLSADSIVPLAADRVDSYLATRSVAADRAIVVISGVQIINAPGPGNVTAQGSATVTYYQGGRKIRSESVRGKLVGNTFTITERK